MIAMPAACVMRLPMDKSKEELDSDEKIINSRGGNVRSNERLKNVEASAENISSQPEISKPEGDQGREFVRPSMSSIYSGMFRTIRSIFHCCDSTNRYCFKAGARRHNLHELWHSRSSPILFENLAVWSAPLSYQFRHDQVEHWRVCLLQADLCPDIGKSDDCFERYAA